MKIEICIDVKKAFVFLLYTNLIKSKALLELYLYIYKNECVCVCVCVWPSITLERLERFRPNLVNILLYVCVRFRYIYIYICLSPKHQFTWEFG
jgi:hypothetical protein